MLEYVDYLIFLKERLLPKWPVCPGPKMRNKENTLLRPEMTNLFTLDLSDIFNSTLSM